MKTIERERWDEKEIRKAARIILNAQKSRSLFIRILDEAVHWILVLITLLGNIIISGLIVFMSVVLNVAYFYIMIVLIAVVFGVLIEIPLSDIEKLDKNKHFISSIMLPLLALVNIYILIGMKNFLENFSNVQFEFNAVIAGIVYGVCLLVPHFVNFVIKNQN